MSGQSDDTKKDRKHHPFNVFPPLIQNLPVVGEENMTMKGSLWNVSSPLSSQPSS